MSRTESHCCQKALVNCTKIRLLHDPKKETITRHAAAHLVTRRLFYFTHCGLYWDSTQPMMCSNQLSRHRLKSTHPHLLRNVYMRIQGSSASITLPPMIPLQNRTVKAQNNVTQPIRHGTNHARPTYSNVQQCCQTIRHCTYKNVFVSVPKHNILTSPSKIQICKANIQNQ